MSKRSILVLCLGLIFSLQVVFAASCNITVSSKTTAELLREVPSLNAQLQSCNPDIPSDVQKLVKNGVFLLDLTDADDMTLSLSNGVITGMNVGSTGSFAYKIVLNSCQLTRVLSSSNKLGAFLSLYLNGGAKLSGGSIINKVKLFFVKLFGKSALQKASIPVDACMDNPTSNKPDNCYETYMQGHEEYQYAKVEWERRLAETKNICQTQTAQMPKGGNCIYLFEQIKNNDKKWLCWYK